MIYEVKRKQLRKAFNREVKRARRIAPEKMQKIIVHSPFELIAVSKEVVDIFIRATGCAKKDIKNHPDIKRIMDWQRMYLEEINCEGIVHENVRFTSKKIKVSAITIDDTLPLMEGFKGNFTEFMQYMGVLHHELGHRIVNGVSKSKSLKNRHLSECEAEAYKALMHKKVFGNNTDYAKYYNYSKTILTGKSPRHYYDVINLKVEDLANELAEEGLSFAQLSDKQILRLAGDIAVKYAFDEQKLNRMIDAYKPMAKEYKDTGKMYYNHCAIIMMRNFSDLDVYRAGRLYLSDDYLETGIKRGFQDCADLLETFNKWEREDSIETNLARARDSELGDEAITVKTVIEDYFKLPYKGNRLSLASPKT